MQLDYQTKGYSTWGASMGRKSDTLDLSRPLTIRRVPLDQGGYDPGGAYWGSGDGVPPLFCISDADGNVEYVRAASFEAAQAEFPGATWDTMTIAKGDVADMVSGYMAAALWSSTDDREGHDDEPLDRNFCESDLSPETRAQMEADCARFIEHNAWTLAALMLQGPIDWSQMGHDFWLTRNGHGAGFGDGDWLDPWDDMLRDACGWRTQFREVHLYVGDDDLIHMG